MGLFNNSFLHIKKNSDITDFLNKVKSKPHLISTEEKNEKIFSILLDIKDHLNLTNFVPLKMNKEMGINKEYHFHISTVFDFYKIEADFDATFLGFGIEFDSKALCFSIPHHIRYTEEVYNIVPTDEDNVSISFKLRDLPEFRKLTLINMKEMQFSADLDYALKDNPNSSIYNIELKLPLDKVVINGNLSKLKKNTYTIENFLYGAPCKSALSRYIEYDFQRKTPELQLHFKNESVPLKKNTNNTDKSGQYIFIFDTVPAVTTYIFEYLSKRIEYPLIQINFLQDIFEVAKQYNPYLLVVNINSMDLNIEEAEKLLDSLKCNLIYTFNRNSHQDIMQVKSNYLVGKITKPIDPNLIIEILNKLEE